MQDTPENTATTMEIAELETERLPLSEVEPHPDNPRIHSPEQIEAIQDNYRRHGLTAGSMAIQLSRKRLYKGHAVYESLFGLGITHSDFVVKDLTDAETLAQLALDNALSDMSTNDFPKLKAISVKLEKMDVPIERMGQTLESMANLEFAYQQGEADNSIYGPRQDPEELWEGMPEFEQEDVAHRSFRIHFATQGDVDEFARVIGQTITDKTRYVWFPEAENLSMKELECTDDES